MPALPGILLVEVHIRIVIQTQVFPPETHPTAVMVRQLADHLADHGHEVVVVAGFPHHPKGNVMHGFRMRPLLREQRGSIQVIRAGHLTSSSRRIFARATVMASQAMTTALAGATRDADVILSYGPPLVGPALAGLTARARAIPMVSVVYDLYPDVAIDGGHLKSPLLVAMARLLERASYRLSDRIVVLSEGFRRSLIGRGVPSERLAAIPVWLAPDEIRPLARETSWRREQGIASDKTVVLYAGSLGIVSGAEVLVRAAEELRANPDVEFVIVGEGGAKNALRHQACAARLTNLRFLPFQPRERLCELQSSADISVVTLAPNRGRTSVPSKVVGYMAAGRPIVASVDLDSDTADTIRNSGCGLVVPPGDGAALGKALGMLAADSQRRAEMGLAARHAFEEGHAAPPVLNRFRELLEEVVTCRPASSGGR